MTTLDEFLSAITSYTIGFVSVATLEQWAATCGVLLLMVRLAYDTIRLVRYIRDPKHRG